MTNPITDARTLFAFADYRRTWGIGALTGMARWLEFIAVAIFAFELTRSPELVALLAVLRMLPYAALGLVVGALADAVDRRWLLSAGLAVMAAISAGMVALSATGHASYAAVAVATMVSGAFWTIDMPARRRLMVDAIGPAQMPAALGFDNATMYAARAIGPLLGGLAYGLVGVTGIFAGIFVCYAVCWLVARRIEAGRDGGQAAKARPAFDLRSVLPPAELLGDRRVRVALGVTIVFNMWCFPFVSMVPVIAQKDFALSHTMVGIVSACDGIGGTIGALLIGALVTQRTLFRFYVIGVLAFLLLVGALSFQLTVATSVPVLLLLGIASASFSATQYALIYVLSPPEMRGRATGLLSLCIGTSLLGHYHAGYIFERFGSVIAMQLMAAEGLAVLLLLIAAWWRISAAGRAI